MTAERIRIVIAEDQPFVRESLSFLLSSTPDFEVVGHAEDGESAVEMACRLRPDVVVMDCLLPKLSGPEATRRITQECPGVRVIGNSWREDADLVQAVLEAGAASFVSKGANVSVLIDAIRSAAGASPRAPQSGNGPSTPLSA
jgi:DNA-binding NarL/FixJ family response regulator